jgi:hypothetical protein
MFSMTTLSLKIEARVAPQAACFRARRLFVRKSIQARRRLKSPIGALRLSGHESTARIPRRAVEVDRRPGG